MELVARLRTLSTPAPRARLSGFWRDECLFTLADGAEPARAEALCAQAGSLAADCRRHIFKREAATLGADSALSRARERSPLPAGGLEPSRHREALRHLQPLDASACGDDPACLDVAAEILLTRWTHALPEAGTLAWLCGGAPGALPPRLAWKPHPRLDSALGELRERSCGSPGERGLPDAP